jgi:YHS domain-containing protein
MHVDRQEALKAGRTAAHGKDVHFFCSDHCKHRFAADPSRYAKPQAEKP